MAGEEKAEKTKESTKESTKKSTDAAAALFGRTPERVRKSEDEEREERRAFLSAYIEEQLEKWEKGEIKELSFQIGARLFTEQEWDVLLEKFDAAMESIRESMRQELERIKAEEQREKERLEREAAKEALQREAALRAENAKLLSEALFAAESSLLLAETTVCTYPSTDFCKAGRCYIICYTKEQITCKGGGTAGSREWSVPFENALQYESTMEFLSRFPKGKNLRFAAHKGFWEDFLQDGIDADRFCAFFEEMEADGPGVFAIAGDAMYSCQEKEEWMQYMNPPKESVLG